LIYKMRFSEAKKRSEWGKYSLCPFINKNNDEECMAEDYVIYHYLEQIDTKGFFGRRYTHTKYTVDYYNCCKYYWGEVCKFGEKIFNIISELKKTDNVRTHKMKDGDYLPYYYLHELIKYFPVDWYDRILLIILDNLTMGAEVLHRRVYRANAIMCAMRKECAYKPIIESMEKKDVVGNEE